MSQLFMIPANKDKWAESTFRTVKFCFTRSLPLPVKSVGHVCKQFLTDLSRTHLEKLKGSED